MHRSPTCRFQVQNASLLGGKPFDLTPARKICAQDTHESHDASRTPSSDPSPCCLCFCFFSFFGLFVFFFFFFLVFFFSFFCFFFFLKNKINMLGFLPLGMVKGGSTRDAFTQKVALSGDPRVCFDMAKKRRSVCRWCVRKHYVQPIPQ